ncbi:MAG: DoxX family protein [Ginsengibacter sp.]
MERSNNSKQTKINKIIFWISTGLIALFELSGAMFMNSQMAIDGMHHLQLPDWFRWEVSIGHLIGGFLLVIPVGRRIKEWVYVAFGIDFISAFIAYLSIDGWVGNTISPLVMLTLLVVSYTYYHKMQQQQSWLIAAA